MRFIAITVSAVCTLLMANDGRAQDTEWLVAPYLWYPDISLDQSSGGGGGISGSDLLSKTDAVGMIRIEAAQNRWGLTFDYIFLGLADSRAFNLPSFPGGGTGVNANLDLTVIEFAGLYRPSGRDEGLQYLAGLRSIDAEKLLLVTPPLGAPTQRFESSERVTDFMLGLRYQHRFTNRWDANLRGDFSFGDSEGTLNLLAGIGFRFNDLFAMNLGYRHVNLEYESVEGGVTESTEIELSGPTLGFLFRF